MKRGLFLLFVALVAATYQVTGEDICCLPKVVGKCDAVLPRWYYNGEKGACERFTYGGCDANKNNFLTKCACQKRCGDDKDICCLPKVVGPCKAAMPRWYFNGEKGACEMFTYGGCGANKNNFLTKCACQKRCGDNKDICCLPKVVGTCKAALPRWYYNGEKGACERFTYGGCDANKNNFLTKCACQKRCGDDKDICCQNMEVGPCLAAFPRWYYNSTYEECRPFTYGGCGGNQNNFEKKCQCEQTCLIN